MSKSNDGGPATEQIIMYESPEAATPCTITGWKSINGQFWNDEHMARYVSSTHHLCKCGKRCEKKWTICDDCRHKQVVERWNKLEHKPWDGKTYICTYDSDDSDKFFKDIEELLEYCKKCQIAPQDLMLVHCDPDHGPSVDPDIFKDHQPEDEDYIPPDVLKAMDALNKVIADNGPYCWWPGKIAVDPVSLAAHEGESTRYE